MPFLRRVPPEPDPAVLARLAALSGAPAAPVAEPPEPPEPAPALPGAAPAPPEPPASIVEALRNSLPETLRDGRLDPGRRGAVALAGVAAFALVVTSVVVWRGRPRTVAVPLPSVVAASPMVSGALLVVDVAGAVRRPGLVRLPPGSRVADALAAAGGVRPGASTAGLNLARKVVDGEQVLVGPPAAPGAAPRGSPAPGTPLDLNAATADQLDALPGVGPVLADRIVEWRTAHGPFTSVDQLREVSGIGARKLASIRELLTV